MTPCDADPLVAMLNQNDPAHVACVQAAARLSRMPLLTTWPCFAEAMYVARRASGYPAQQRLWRLRQQGRLALHHATEDEVDRMIELMDKYRDLPMDLADASLVAAAESLGLRTVFTLDRHFHAYRLIDGSALRVVP